jgi:hypothetical protein
MLEKESRVKVIDMSYEIIGNTTNTLVLKEISDIGKTHTYYKLLKFMQSNCYELTKIMNKNNSNEYGKIRYFFTIIKNKIGDYKELIENTEVNNFEYVKVVNYTPTKKKTFTEYINEY